jgi:carbon storage regulator CsrA
MLVLSRKHQEPVIVGRPDDGEYLLRITVIEIRGNRVTLGFEAAKEVPVHRSERWEQRRSSDDPLNGSHSGTVAANEATHRWEDDGGGTDLRKYESHTYEV